MVKLIIISLAFTLDRVNDISYVICLSTQHTYYVYAILSLSGLEAPKKHKTEHKWRLKIWTSPDSQYQNLIDYILHS